MATTKQVLDMVRDDIKTVFPMVAKSTGGNRPELVGQRLVGQGVDDVADVMTDKVNHTTVNTVTVAEAGVVRLTGEHAEVLVFGSRDETVGAAKTYFRQGVTLLIGLDRVAGTWRISRVDQDPRADQVAAGHPAVHDELTAERDEAVAAALDLATRLTQFDGADPGGSYDRWIAASVEPLTARLRADRDQYVDSGLTTWTVAPHPIVAPVYVRRGDASVLVSLYAFHDPSSAFNPVRIQVVRVEDGSWRAAAFEQVDTVGIGS